MTGGSDILVIIAQDECGNKGELPISVSTRSCPCPEGMCAPDPGFPRGVGFYVCECMSPQGDPYPCMETHVQIAP